MFDFWGWEPTFYFKAVAITRSKFSAIIVGAAMLRSNARHIYALFVELETKNLI